MHSSLRLLGAFLCLAVASSLPAQISGLSQGRSSNNTPSYQAKKTPNILFIIMDDVGIDQMKIFGYGGATPPLTPNIDTVAHAGVRFRNVWSMPECSPSRAIFFEGRYPLRTHVNSALLPNDLANSQVSPFEVTTPQILRTKNYKSGLFGKFHLAGPDNNEFSYATPHVLGWDYFDGFLDASMHPIDTTLGGQFPASSNIPPTYTCGFVPNRTHDPQNGSDHGACVQPDKSCTELTRSTTMENPGFSCLQQGGIYVREQTCRAAKKLPLDFTLDNAYYAWNRVINTEDGTVKRIMPTSPKARGYVSDVTVSTAVDWIKQQNKTKKPWMTTVSFGNDHTPYQQPPEYLLPGPTPDSTGFACTGNSLANTAATRILSNQMIEAMDTEISNLLVNAGVANRTSTGALDYHPEQTNTMVIIIGDNGTFAPGVKEPFDTNRAKGYVYQTGVWVPLIIAGPLVASPDREVTSMVNIADLFHLFGEIAGADVRKIVPASHVLDSYPMLAYLTTPKQPSIRQTNFTQIASNFHVGTPPPCVIPLTNPATCVQMFYTKQVCNLEGGKWFGADPDEGNVAYTSCCDVQRNVQEYQSGLTQQPIDQQAVRNDRYKLVQKTVQVCGSTPSGDVKKVLDELYEINERIVLPQLDKEGTALCGENGTACPTNLNREQEAAYKQLIASLNNTISSEPACLGDGNSDKVVNFDDVLNWYYFATNGIAPDGGGTPNTSSWYDFNLDGKTNFADLAIIAKNLDKRCIPR